MSVERRLLAEVLKHIEAWEDAEERYEDWSSNGDNPRSVGARFIKAQVHTAQDSLRALRDEISAELALGDTGRATPAELPKQFALMTIRRWVDEGFAKMARHYGQPAPNGFAGEAAAAVWTHAQEILEAAVRAPSGEGRWQPEKKE